MEQDRIMETIEQLIRENDTCVLATTSGKEPHTSLMVYTASPDCRTLYLVTPRQTRKYANMIDTPTVSLLIDTRCKDAAQSVRALTLRGTAGEIHNETECVAVRQEFIGKRPDLAVFLDEPDTAFISVSIHSAQLLSGLRDARYVLFEAADGQSPSSKP